MVAQILWQAPRLLPLAIVIAAATAIAVGVFYVPQARRLRQPWRWGLPLLRLAVGLALAASVAQPALVRSQSSGKAGAIAVLVDGSRSMSIVDRRTPAQRVALADALGLLPADARSFVAPGLDRELAALSTRASELAAAAAEASYAKLSGQGVITAQARYEQLAAGASTLAAELVRRGQNMRQPSELGTALAAVAAPEAGANGSDYAARIAAVQTALTAAQAVSDASTYARPDIKLICDEIATRSRVQLAERAVSLTKGGVLASVPASATYGYAFSDDLRPLPGIDATSQPSIERLGLRSDIAGVIRTAAARMQGRPAQAIVVLSDGRQVGGESDFASSFVDAGVPVYAVAVGTPAPRDVAIMSAALPPRQFVGETGTVRVELRGVGMKGRRIDVRLDVASRSQTKAVTFAETTATAEFSLTLDAAGTYDVTVTATPQDDEATTENNSLRRRVVVTADRARVALVGASASWDFQHLRSALSRVSWAAVEAEVLDAPGAVWSVPPDEVAQRSIVILCDVAAHHLSPLQWDALYRFVADRGGSLVFVAGGNTTSPQFIDSPLLTDLLPFRAGARPAWRTWPGEQPLFRFQPAPGAGELASLKLSDDPSSGAEQWLELPALFQYLPVSELKPNTTPLLVERESGLAVLTESRLGLGRVVFLGLNETWRWRSGANAGAHDRFWLQLVRHAVDEPYAVRNGSLRLDADRVTLEPGQPLRVRARVARPKDARPGDATLPLKVLRDGVQTDEIAMSKDADAAGRYTATLDHLAAGASELRVRDPSDASIVASLTVHVEPDVESEMRDVSGDERMLRRLAEATGGEFLTLAEWNTLPRRLREAQQTSGQVIERRLWDSPQLFAFVLGCLGIEWAMRKRLGMA